MIINADGEDRVYDVTKYLSDHPGGPEIMLEFGGRSIYLYPYIEIVYIVYTQYCVKRLFLVDRYV